MDKYEGAALATTFVDMQPAIRHLVRKFIRRYGGDFEEYVSLCTLEFVRIYLRYYEEKDKTKQAPFEWWSKYKLEKKLLMERRKELRRLQLLPPARHFEGCERDPEFFDLEDFIAALGPDEDTAVRLAVEQPTRVKAYAKKFPNRSAGRPGYGTGNGQAVAIKKYLARKYGWSKHRIRKAFESVREKL